MRLVIIEDDPLLLENLTLLLRGEEGITVAGSYRSAEDALHSLKDVAPDVMLTDLGLPGMSGVDLIKKAKQEMPSIEIMAHTVFEDRDKVFAAIKAGASGYILKGSTPREIIESIHSLYKGGAPMSPKIARKLIYEFQGATGTGAQFLLTQRETEIVKLVEDGLTYKEIGEALKISTHTVHTHIKNMYEKLQAKDRNDAIIKARKKGII
ncbi:MAG TPA: response regulator transcription factor [Nitrospirota bacterium]|nr:response regulator transcription factor [Nitrospirota bacterium]